MNKIKYEISRNEANNPRLETPSEYSMLWELGSMSHEYVRKIVKALEEIKSGEKETYDFGHDMTIVCIEKGRTYLWYGYPKKEMDVDFDNIYNMMRDWRDYLDEWEKETGKVKK